MTQERKLEITKLVMGLIFAGLCFIVYSLMWFSPVIDVYGDHSIIEIIFDEDFMRYSGARDALAAIGIFLVFSIGFSALSFSGMARYGDLSRGWLYASEVCFLVAFAVCLFSDYSDPKGLLYFTFIIYVMAIAVAEMQISARIAVHQPQVRQSSSLLGAYPKQILSQFTYNDNLPTIDDFEALIDKSNLREHLFKTHPNNQLYISVYQQIYSKFAEMIKSPSPSNLRHIKYEDTKNVITTVLKYENHTLSCDIRVNL